MANLGPEHRFPIDTQLLESTELGKVLAAGRLVATVHSIESGKHITIQMRPMAKTAGRWRDMPYPLASHVFIDVPASGDGGFNDKVGTLYPLHSSNQRWAGWLYPDDNADPARLWCARRILLACVGQADTHTENVYEILTSTFCLRCGRELTEPESIERGLGPHCAEVVSAEYGKRHERKLRPERPPIPVGDPIPATVGDPVPAGQPSAPAQGQLEIKSTGDVRDFLRALA
jgi:hypothetical protein